MTQTQREQRVTRRPLVLFDGCSWRRIRTEDYKEIVIEPTIASDGHPDLIMKYEDVLYMLHCVNNYDQLVEALKGLLDCDLYQNLIGGYQFQIEQAEQALATAQKEG